MKSDGFGWGGLGSEERNLFTSRKLYLTGGLFFLGGGGFVEGMNRVVGLMRGMAHYMCGVPLGLDRRLAPLYI